MSLWHRREYAADLPRGLPSGSCIPLQEFSRSPKRMARIRATPGPDPPDSSRCRFKRRKNAGSSRTPLHHARRARTIWQYWHVPALSGPLSPSPAPPGSGCPQLQQPCCDRVLVQVFYLHSNQQRLTAQTRSPTEPNCVTADTARHPIGVAGATRRNATSHAARTRRCQPGPKIF